MSSEVRLPRYAGLCFGFGRGRGGAVIAVAIFIQALYNNYSCVLMITKQEDS
jgi:hypothetical protein